MTASMPHDRANAVIKLAIELASLPLDTRPPELWIELLHDEVGGCDE